MNKGGVLITRPAMDDAVMTAWVEAEGFKALFSPVLQIVLSAVTLPEASLYQGLIFSSANAVRGFMLQKHSEAFLQKPAFAVGAQTAEALRLKGFTTIHTGTGTVQELPAIITAHLNPQDRLLHPRGRDVREGRLHDNAWAVDGITLYAAEPVGALTPEAVMAIKQAEIVAVLFYSARSAAAFTAAAKGLDFGRIQALCLANSVIESLDIKAWGQIRVAGRPDQSGMQALLAALKTEMETQGI